jgi:DNA-binding transcriptional regulator YiaG
MNYWRNPIKDEIQELENKLTNLEVTAAQFFVSLATYLRVSLYLRQNMYDLPEDIADELLGYEADIDQFEETGVLSPELGYEVFKYLEKHPEEDVIDEIFIQKMKDPPTAAGKDNYQYWTPGGARGPKPIAYTPWSTDQHLSLLSQYPITPAEKEIIAYHLRGPLEESPHIEGLGPILQAISQTANRYTQLVGDDYDDIWEPHQHTQDLELAVDLLNQYLSWERNEELFLGSSDIWLQRGKSTKKKSYPSKKKTTKKKKTRKKKTRKKTTKKTKKPAVKTKTDILLGKQVSSWRTQNKITKKALATDLKISTDRLTRFEKGHPVLNDDQLAKLMELLE